MSVRSAVLMSVALVAVLSAFSGSAQAACEPSMDPVTVCAYQACDESQLGEAKLDGDGQNIISCLRSSSNPAETIWKKMTSGKYSMTDNYVKLVITSGHGWDWRTCPDGYAVVAMQISMSDHWEMQCRQITAP